LRRSKKPRENFCNSRGTGRDATEAKNGSYKSDYEKNDCIVQHDKQKGGAKGLILDGVSGSI